MTQEELDRLLQETDSTFDLEQWNAEWDAYENETNRQAYENEQTHLADMTILLK